ncbi:hypothetical protein MICRO8M_10065 [Microbacterium sp. 8M]|nr:hypothetical protein MICRO8M_10065 [Microbacterium sp. 8M]
MHRLGAVVPHPHGDTAGIEELPDVVRVHPVDDEGLQRHALSPARGAEQAHSVDRAETLVDPAFELLLVRVHGIHAESVEVAHRGGERDRLGHRLGARLEALRRRQELGALERDARDHRTTGEERRQCGEHLASPVETADAVGPLHLVAGEHGEVDAEGGQVERQVRGRLARVEHGERADFACERDDLGDRVDDAEHVGDVREGDDARAGSDDLGRVIEIEGAVIADPDHAQDGACAGRELLPGDDVRVVLGLGHDELVAGLQGEAGALRSSAAGGGVADRVCDEVEALGRAVGPDQVVLVRADEAGDGGAGVFVELGRLGGEGVRPAVHGRIRALQEVAFGIQHDARLLARRRGVEIRQRRPVHGLGEQGEVRTDGGHIEDGRTHVSTLRQYGPLRAGRRQANPAMTHQKICLDTAAP